MLRKNDRVRLTITDMGVNGEGIGKYDPPSGMTFFVKNAVIGDEVLAIVTGLKKGYGYAKVLEILKPSTDRVKPACPLAERCGGCQIMQLSYEAQLKFKEHKVRSDLERIGGQTDMEVEPIIGMEPAPSAGIQPDTAQPLHFRNKMQFPVGWDREGHVVTGFYAGRTHYIIAAANCPVSPEVNTIVLEAVRTFLEKHRISAYNEETGQGLIRHVLIRNGFSTGQIMVCLVLNSDRLAEDQTMEQTGKCPGAGRQQTVQQGDIHIMTWLERELAEYLTSLKLPDPWAITSICLNINKEKTNVILGKEVRCLSGKTYIEDQIASWNDAQEPLTFRISPLSFFQTNAAQTVKLYDTALEFAGLTGKETVWDLYCGAGTISLFLARRAAFVHGVEIVPEAIRDAQENAERNGITNVKFYCGKSEEIFPVMAGKADAAMDKRENAAPEGETDVVVLDPPRKGCDPALLAAIRRTAPERIVYVSCDPATLARDVKILCEPAEKDAEASYELKKVRPVDMFPHTTHVETVAQLFKRDVNHSAAGGTDLKQPLTGKEKQEVRKKS